MKRHDVIAGLALAAGLTGATLALHELRRGGSLERELTTALQKIEALEREAAAAQRRGRKLARAVSTHRVSAAYERPRSRSSGSSSVESARDGDGAEGAPRGALAEEKEEAREVAGADPAPTPASEVQGTEAAEPHEEERLPSSAASDESRPSPQRAHPLAETVGPSLDGRLAWAHQQTAELRQSGLNAEPAAQLESVLLSVLTAEHEFDRDDFVHQCNSLLTPSEAALVQRRLAPLLGSARLSGTQPAPSRAEQLSERVSEVRRLSLTELKARIQAGCPSLTDEVLERLDACGNRELLAGLVVRANCRYDGVLGNLLEQELPRQ